MCDKWNKIDWEIENLEDSQETELLFYGRRLL